MTSPILPAVPHQCGGDDGVIVSGCMEWLCPGCERWMPWCHGHDECSYCDECCVADSGGKHHEIPAVTEDGEIGYIEPWRCIEGWWAAVYEATLARQEAADAETP